MQIIDKNQLNDELGKFGMWSGKAGNAIISEVKYLGGIPDFDELVEKGKIDISVSNGISFEVRPKGLEVYIMSGFTSYRIGLLDEGINFWAFEPQKRLTEKKSKSILGRALVGGLLLGPVGAIVGGMTGIGDKESIKSLKGIDNLLLISYTDENNKEYMLVFDCSNKKSKKVLDFFNKNYPKKYKEEDSEDLMVEESPKVNVADELIKLKALLDEGLLTRKEFDDQKSKLLNK